MDAARALVERVLSAAFPLQASGWELTWAAEPRVSLAPSGALAVCLALSGPERHVRGEAVLVSGTAATDPARVQRYIAAWVRVASLVLRDGEMAGLLPFDLVSSRVLDDGALESEADFVSALLSPFRLGALVPAHAAPAVDVVRAIDVWLAERFPVARGAVAVSLVQRSDGHHVRDDEAGVHVVLRAQLFTGDGGVAIHGYRVEGDQLLVPAAALARQARTAAYLGSWVSRLEWVVQHFDWRAPGIQVSDLVAPHLALHDDPNVSIWFRMHAELKHLETHDPRVLRDPRWLEIQSR